MHGHAHTQISHTQISHTHTHSTQHKPAYVSQFPLMSSWDRSWQENWSSSTKSAVHPQSIKNIIHGKSCFNPELLRHRNEPAMIPGSNCDAINVEQFVEHLDSSTVISCACWRKTRYIPPSLPILFYTHTFAHANIRECVCTHTHPWMCFGVCVRVRVRYFTFPKEAFMIWISWNFHAHTP